MTKIIRLGLAAFAVIALIANQNVQASEETESTEAPAATEAAPAATEAAPAPAAAKVLRVVGMAEVKGPGDTMFHAVSGGSDLPMSGTFRVMPGGKAQIELPSGGIVLIKDLAVVQLDQIAKDKNSEISIPLGEFLIGFKAPLPNKQVFKVRTPAAVAGIRGTLFWGLASPDLTSTFACFHDTITLEAGGKTVDLTPGLLSSAKFGDAPSDPKPHGVPAEYLQEFAVEGSLEGLPDLLK